MLNRLIAWLTGQASTANIPPPPAPPAGLTIRVEIEDAEEEVTGPSQELPPIANWIGEMFMIRYVDASMNESLRRITLRSVQDDPPDDAYLRSWCHERDAWRSFKLSRIREVIDIRTGEVFDDPAEFFERDLGIARSAGRPQGDRLKPAIAPRERPAQKPTTLARKALEPCLPELHVLAFLGRADGRYRSAEKEVIANYAAERCPACATERKWLIGYVGRLAPDQDTYLHALKAIDWSDEKILGRMLKALQDVAASDDEFSPMEKEIVDFFGRHAAEGRSPIAKNFRAS